MKSCGPLWGEDMVRLLADVGRSLNSKVGQEVPIPFRHVYLVGIEAKCLVLWGAREKGALAL